MSFLPACTNALSATAPHGAVGTPMGTFFPAATGRGTSKKITTIKTTGKSK